MSTITLSLRAQSLNVFVHGQSSVIWFIEWINYAEMLICIQVSRVIQRSPMIFFHELLYPLSLTSIFFIRLAKHHFMLNRFVRHSINICNALSADSGDGSSQSARCNTHFHLACICLVFASLCIMASLCDADPLDGSKGNRPPYRSACKKNEITRRLHPQNVDMSRSFEHQ